MEPKPPQIVAISIKNGIIEVEKLPKGVMLLMRDEDYPKGGDTPDGVDCSCAYVDDDGQIVDNGGWSDDYCKECLGPVADCKCQRKE